MMKKYRWWLVLAIVYAAFIGLTALKYSADAERSSEGKYVSPKDRSHNPVELAFGVMDGSEAWEKLNSRLDAEESLKRHSAGTLDFWQWFKGYTSFYGVGFLPFTYALLATWGLAVVIGVRVYSRFRPATAA